MYVVDFHHDKMHHRKRHELFKENRQFKIKQTSFSYQTIKTDSRNFAVMTLAVDF